MKICFVVHRPNLTGANRSLLDLLDGLDRDNVEPHVLVNSRGPLLAELRKRDVPYHFALIPPSLNSDNRLLDLLKRLLNTTFLHSIFVGSIKLRFRQLKPDIVHNNSLLSIAGMQAARNMQIPYLCHIREFLWEDHHRKLIREKQAFELIGDADIVLSISGPVRDKFQPLVKKEILVIPDGIHTDLYDIAPHPILNGEEVHILMAGRIHPGKGQLDAVKAVGLVQKKVDRPIHLHILGTVGDQAYAAEINDYIGTHQLDSISVEDFHPDLSALRSACDIGLTCSYSEGLGRVTIENMLSSLLVIASDSGGTLEIINDRENGLFYRTGSPEDLAEKIEWAIHHPERSQQIAAQGHDETLRTFDCKAYASRIEAIYDSIQRERN